MASIKPCPSLQLIDGCPVTTSLDIADHFRKRHDNVLQSIENIDCSEEFRRLNFQGTTYQDAQGKSRPLYHITRDGFVFLAMGFTGPEAARWKEAYIRAFNTMERQLREGDVSKADLIDQLDRLYTENAALKDEVLTLLRDKVQALEHKRTRRPSRPLSDGDIAEIRRLSAQGLTQAAIAKRLGRSNATVSYVLRDLGGQA